MKIKHLFLLCLFCFSFFIDVQAQKLSKEAEISVITCAPGNELYSTFGHTAIRVKDTVFRFDKVYNYGTFNFETPNFYLKFSRGQLDYMLSVSPYKNFVISYMNENRWIKEQVLDLNFSQKKDIYRFLEINALPENKYYRYDFFYDNCATRVKDVIRDVLGENLIIPESVTNSGTTFKGMLEPYLEGKDWERLGINIALGHPANKVVTPDEATFLPDYTELYFEKCLILKDGQNIPLVKSVQMLYETEVSSELSKPRLFTPSLLFWFLFAVFLLISYIEFRKKSFYIIVDKALYYITGIAGIIILLFWFATEHKAVVDNWDILWGMPLFLFIAFLLKKENNKKIIKYFLFSWAIILFVTLIIDLSVYNLYDIAIIPLILTIILRSSLYVFLKR